MKKSISHKVIGSTVVSTEADLFKVTNCRVKENREVNLYSVLIPSLKIFYPLSGTCSQDFIPTLE